MNEATVGTKSIVDDNFDEVIIIVCIGGVCFIIALMLVLSRYISREEDESRESASNFSLL